MPTTDLDTDIWWQQLIFTYHSATQPTGITYVDGNTADVVGTTQDPMLIVEHHEIFTATPGALQDLRYTYDAVGNITQIEDVSDTLAGSHTYYTYDDLYRLINA